MAGQELALAKFNDVPLVGNGVPRHKRATPGCATIVVLPYPELGVLQFTAASPAVPGATSRYSGKSTVPMDTPSADSKLPTPGKDEEFGIDKSIYNAMEAVEAAVRHAVPPLIRPASPDAV